MAERSTVGSDGWRHVPISNTLCSTMALVGGAVDFGVVGRTILCGWRGWTVVDMGLRDGSLLCKEVRQLRRDTREVVGRVLPR